LVLLEILGAREFVMGVMEGVFESKAVSKG
jgi:hypothetical protein